MRTVKYQAWTDEGMINVTRITFAGEVVYVVSDNDEHDGYEFQISPDKLRCFTGLKDKNGTEIWEGDVVKKGDGLNYEVRWSGAAFGFRNVMWNYRCEVVGNIWENPELLKAIERIESDE